MFTLYSCVAHRVYSINLSDLYVCPFWMGSETVGPRPTKPMYYVRMFFIRLTYVQRLAFQIKKNCLNIFGARISMKRYLSGFVC